MNFYVESQILNNFFEPSMPEKKQESQKTLKSLYAIWREVAFQVKIKTNKIYIANFFDIFSWPKLPPRLPHIEV